MNKICEHLEGGFGQVIERKQRGPQFYGTRCILRV